MKNTMMFVMIWVASSISYVSWAGSSADPQCTSKKQEVLGIISKSLGLKPSQVRRVAKGVWHNHFPIRGNSCLFLKEFKNHYTVGVSVKQHGIDGTDALGVCEPQSGGSADFIVEANLRNQGFETMGLKANRDFSQIRVTGGKLRGSYQRISSAQVAEKCGVQP